MAIHILLHIQPSLLFNNEPKLRWAFSLSSHTLFTFCTPSRFSGVRARMPADGVDDVVRKNRTRQLWEGVPPRSALRKSSLL